MMKFLSEDKQNELVEHLREYIQDLKDELKWQQSFNKSGVASSWDGEG